MPSRKKRTQSAVAQPLNGTASAKKRKTENAPPTPPATQSALLLHEKRQPYVITTGHSTPYIQHDWEVLIKVQAIGLNPIDWKAPYGLEPIPPRMHVNIRIETMALEYRYFRTLQAESFPGSL
jgi:hypothetical protein